MELTIIDMFLYGAVLLIIVGFFIYKLITDQGSIKDDDQTVMELLREVHLMSETEQDRLRTGIKNKVFKDEVSEDDNCST